MTNCTEAILIAAVNIGGLVALTCDGTITLSRTLTVSTDLILDASGYTMTISGGNSNRLFQVKPGVSLTLKGITLANGQHGDNGTNAISGRSGSGGAIFNDAGVVVLQDCNLSNHRAMGSDGAPGDHAVVGNGEDADDGGSGQGGAIFNKGGILLVNNTTFSGNSAEGGFGGEGGNGTSAGNGGHGGKGGDGGAGNGGAIYNTANGLVQIFDSTFTSNQVAGGGGGLGGLGGGALGFEGSRGSGSIGGGGAIFNERGRVIVNNCTFSGNTCVGVTGLNGSAGVGTRNEMDGQSGSSALGAAVVNEGGMVAMTNATFFANIAVGGNGGNGGAGVAGGLGNDGGGGGQGGPAKGAGFYNQGNGTATLVNCTFSSNSAISGTGGTGGPGSGFTGRKGRQGNDGLGSGGGIFNEHGVVNLKNTLLAYTETGGNCGGATTDGGNNLSSDETCQFHVATSFNKTNPKLAPLGDNGGPTQTAALLTNSPAINAGNDLVSPLSDQRHARRSGASDIGAFEFNGALPETILSARLQRTNEFVLVWPNSNRSFVLETADSLAPQTVWAVVTNAPIILGNQKTVTLGTTNQIRYFRLRRP